MVIKPSFAKSTAIWIAAAGERFLYAFEEGTDYLWWVQYPACPYSDFQVLLEVQRDVDRPVACNIQCLQVRVFRLFLRNGLAVQR